MEEEKTRTDVNNRYDMKQGYQDLKKKTECDNE